MPKRHKIWVCKKKNTASLYDPDFKQFCKCTSMVTFADLFLICPTESANNQKLMLEYEKFQEMQSKMMKMQEEYERQLIEKEESKQRDMERQTEYYETKLQEMTAKLEQVDISPQSQYIITKFIVVTGIMQRTPFCSEFPLSQGTSMFLISAKENLICQFFFVEMLVITVHDFVFSRLMMNPVNKTKSMRRQRNRLRRTRIGRSWISKIITRFSSVENGRRISN